MTTDELDDTVKRNCRALGRSLEQTAHFRFTREWFQKILRDAQLEGGGKKSSDPDPEVVATVPLEDTKHRQLDFESDPADMYIYEYIRPYRENKCKMKTVSVSWGDQLLNNDESLELTGLYEAPEVIAEKRQNEENSAGLPSCPESVAEPAGAPELPAAKEEAEAKRKECVVDEPVCSRPKEQNTGLPECVENRAPPERPRNKARAGMAKRKEKIHVGKYFLGLAKNSASLKNEAALWELSQHFRNTVMTRGQLLHQIFRVVRSRVGGKRRGRRLMTRKVFCHPAFSLSFSALHRLLGEKNGKKKMPIGPDSGLGTDLSDGESEAEAERPPEAGKAKDSEEPNYVCRQILRAQATLQKKGILEEYVNNWKKLQREARKELKANRKLKRALRRGKVSFLKDSPPVDTLIFPDYEHDVTDALSFHVDTRLNGENFSAIIDTGSMISLVGKEELEMIRKNTNHTFYHAKPPTIRGITGNVMPTTTAVWLWTRLGNSKDEILHKFVVSESHRGVLLGLDVLTKLSAGLNYRKENRLLPEVTLQVDGASVPVDVRSPLPAGYNPDVVSNNLGELIVPLKHYKSPPTLVELSVPDDIETGKSYLIQPVGKSHLLYAPPSIVNNYQKPEDFNISVYNLVGRPIYIPKGNLMIEYSEIMDVDEQVFRAPPGEGREKAFEEFLVKHQVESFQLDDPMGKAVYNPEEVKAGENGKIPAEIFQPFCKFVNDDSEIYNPPEFSGLDDTGYSMPDEKDLKTPLKDLFDWDSIPEGFRKYFEQLIEKYPDIWARHEFDISGFSDALGHARIHIDESKELPKFTKPYPLPPEHAKVLKQILAVMERARIIKRIDSDECIVASPVFLVPKKNGKLRLVIDQSKLNLCIKDLPLYSSLPDTKSELTDLSRFSFYTNSDLNWGFHQCKLEAASSRTQGIITQYGLYIFLRLIMGCKASPGIFQDYLERIIHYAYNEETDSAKIAQLMKELEEHPDLPELPEALKGGPYPKLDPLDGAGPYMDDMRLGTEFKTSLDVSYYLHFLYLDVLFGRLSHNDVKLAPKKTFVCQREIEYLGWRIESIIDGKRSYRTIRPIDKRINSIKKCKAPSTKKELQRFCGLVVCLQSIVPLAVREDLAFLQGLTGETVTFEFTEEHERAFERIKQHLTSFPLYTTIPSQDKGKIFLVDASDMQQGGVVLETNFDVKSVLRKRDDKGAKVMPEIALLKNCQKTELTISLMGESSVAKAVMSSGNNFFEALAEAASFNCSEKQKSSQELEKQLVEFVKARKPGKDELSILAALSPELSWEDFVSKMASGQNTADEFGLVVKCAAAMMNAPLFIIPDSIKSESDVMCVLPDHYEEEEEQTVPLWLGYYTQDTDSLGGKYLPLISHKKSSLTSLTSFHYVKSISSLRDLNKNELSAAITRYLRKGPKLGPDQKAECKVLGYFSRKIPSSENPWPPHEKESGGLLHIMHAYSDLIKTSPYSLILSDSSAAVHLVGSVTGQSSAKMNRWGTTFCSLYGTRNVYVGHIRGKFNQIADYLSRAFTCDEHFLDHVQFNSEGREAEDFGLEEKCVYSLEELQKELTENPVRNFVLRDEDRNEEALCRGVRREEDKDFEEELDQLNRDFLRCDSYEDLEQMLGEGEDEMSQLSFEQQQRETDLIRSVRAGTAELPTAIIDFRKFSDKIKDLKIPLEELEKKISWNNIASAQKEHLGTEIAAAEGNKLNREKPDLELFYMKNSLLGKYSKNRKTGEFSFLPYVPDELYPSVVAYHHLALGHDNRFAMLKNLKSKYFNPEAEEFVMRLVTNCVSCLLVNNLTVRVPYNPQPKGIRPFQYLYLDLLENLPQSNGYSHCLIFVDPFSKLCGAFPLKNKSGRAILNKVMSILQFLGPGVDEIIADNAKQFRNKDLYELAGLLGIKVRWTVQRRSQSKGQVETYVKKISTVLRKYLVASSDVKWDILLNYVVLCLNSKKNPQTKMSPYLAFRGIDEPMRNVLTTPPEDIYSHLTQLATRMKVEKLQGKFREIWDAVRKELDELDEKAKQKYEQVKRAPKIEVGDVVLRRMYRPANQNIRLRERFDTDLWCVITTTDNASLILRLADNLLAKVSNGDIKVIKNQADLERESVPPEVGKILFGAEIDQAKLDQLLREVIAATNFRLPPVKDVEADDRNRADEVKDPLPVEVPKGKQHQTRSKGLPTEDEREDEEDDWLTIETGTETRASKEEDAGTKIESPKGILKSPENRKDSGKQKTVRFF